MALATPQTAAMTRRRASLLALLAAAACPLIEGVVVPRPVDVAPALATASDAPARRVELPRSRVPREDDVDSGDILPATERSVELGRDDAVDAASTLEDTLPSTPLHLGSSTPPRPSSGQSRRLVLDGTLPAGDDGILHHLPHHEVLRTSYEGDVASSSIEFSLTNHREDGRYAVVSGLGLHVQVVGGDGSEGGDAAAAADVPTACRVKVYTKRLLNEAEGIAVDETQAEFILALDAKVLCMGKGQETLLNTDLFLRNYRQSQQAMSSPAGRRLSGEEGTVKHMRESRGLEGSVIENMDEGTVTGASHTSNATTVNNLNTGGLMAGERLYPLLIGSDEILSVYVVVMPPEGSSDDTSFVLLSSPGAEGDLATTEDGNVAKDALEGGPGEAYLTDATLTLHEGSSVTNGVLVGDETGAGGTVDETTVLQVRSPTVFNGAVYYDLLDPATTTLDEYYDEVQYGLLPGDALHQLPGCDRSFSTGYIDTVGSYGLMFDVSSAVTPFDSTLGETKEDSFLAKFRNVEIYGMDLYIRNRVNASFSVYVRNDGGSGGGGGYASYATDAGQTLIGENWDLVAKGVVEGLGPDVGSPLPPDSWRKRVIVEPGQSVGFYVTVHDAPHLRYRNSSLPEGGIYASDDLLNIGAGRSWGEYPLRGDGTDVYFAPREFAGAFHYHVHEGLCETLTPSVAPSYSGDTLAPSRSLVPTMASKHSYAALAAEEGLCPEEGELETSYQDGTGSYGALFDMLAKKDLTLTGIDLNVDWNSGDSTHLLIYARQGSWFGHQNNAASWPYLVVNTTIHRPEDFHNRSIDGPYIPIDAKRNSAIVPKKAFTPLPMKAGETWSLYVAMSNADFRYTLGTSIGKTFASNDEIRAMEGAGAADYPQFAGGTPEKGGVEYTFYAPRVFNGNLRYDYVDDCPSEAPSSVDTTPPPTPVPTLTTTVSYTFYVEHSPEKLKGAVTYDMSFGVRHVLDKFLNGDEDILTGHAKNDELVIERVVANLVSPTEIGYLCYPTPPETCTPISVDVTATHRATATTDEITYALLRQSMRLPTMIDVEGYTIEYVGDRAVETDSEITLSGVPDREMAESEAEWFASVARDFLNSQVTDGSGNDSLRILSVTVNGQVITSDVSQMGDASASASSVIEARNNPSRRLEKSNNVQVSVKGKYRPPPEIDFGDLVESSINRDRELLEKELKDREPPALEAADGEEQGEGASSYFEEAKVVGARKIKEAPKPLSATTVPQDDDAWKGFLNYAAMGVGGLIALLSATFLLRPHRRRAMFGSNKDNASHRRTQPVDVEDQGLLKKSRIRGWGSESLRDSATSGAPSDTKYDPRASANSDRMLAYSNFSSGQPPQFDPRGSDTSGGQRLSFNRGDRGPLTSSGNNGRSGPRTSFRGPPQGHPPPQFDPRGSNTSGGSGGQRLAFNRGERGPLTSSGNNGRPGPRSSFRGPPSGFPPPPGGSGGPRQMANGGPHHMSMPPVRGGPPRMTGQEMAPPRAMRPHGMSMQQGGPPTRPMQHDPRRNQSMMPQHQAGYR